MRTIPTKFIIALDFLLAALLIAGLLMATGTFKQLIQKIENQKLEKAAQAIIPQLHTCPIRSNKCYQQLAVNLLNKYKLGEILRVVEKDQQQQDRIDFVTCHNITHFLGREAYKHSNNIQETFKQCTQVCLTGCYHGVIEQYLVQNHLSVDDDVAITKAIQTLCGKAENYGRLVEFQECVHGLGHGVMFLTDNDLPRTLRICEALSSQDEIDRCQNGAFMQNANSLKDTEHPSKYVKADDPMYPCNILDKKYLSNCYIYQSFRLKEIGRNDWSKIFNLCYSYIPQDYWYQCFRYLGTTMAGLTPNLEDVKANCGFIANDYYRNICIGGVAEILVRNFNGDFSNVIKFCSIVDRENKATCYTKMGQEIAKWARDSNDVVSVCSQIFEKAYQDKCTQPI